jgi:two-component system sensor histidine kinase NreB
VFSNIGKHSATEHVSVTTVVKQSWICITIRDFGRGFAAAQSVITEPANSGRGLTTIEARATILGGSVEIKSKIGKGTTITLKVPAERLPPH